MKKIIGLILSCLTAFTALAGFAGCGSESETISSDYGADAYEYLKYIDKNLSDRDCAGGVNYVDAQNYIKSELVSAGYAANDIKEQEFTFTTKSKGEVTAKNLYIVKKGESDKQIIIGGHYDGTGTGDNGSGTSLNLITAVKFCKVQTYYSLEFVFFSAEEYGCYGSKAFVNAMTEEEKANTVYMINMDSIVAGDYTYLYGGVQNNETKTVNDTQAYDNAQKAAESLGLEFLTNPWTFKNPEPLHCNDEGKYVSNYDESGEVTGTPAYAAPSTGNWSDHAAFKKAGIKYLYFEATNWTLGPDFDGYEETLTAGPVMNTDWDNLTFIEGHFPGRCLKHLTKFSTLLNTLLQQKNLDF